MKRLSLKIKLTLLYTFFMSLVTCAALAILFSLSNREMLANTQNKLTRRVQQSADEVTLVDGEPKVDSDFYSIAQDVYLSVYDDTQYFLYGRSPHGFNVQSEIQDGQIQRIREQEGDWYVYDMSFRMSDSVTVYIRGITSITEAEANYWVTLRFAVILLPGLVLVTAFIGYRFTRRTLLPVRKMTETVRKIRADTDLSRRIGLTKSEKKNGDEIYRLAETFDDMLSQLEEVFQREKQFTSEVSHELRTPVSVIIAQCGQCLEDRELSDAQKRQIRLIEKKAKDMAGMIGQLLFLSRADQGRQPVQKEELDISELTLMIIEEQKFLVQEKGLDVEIQGEIEPGIHLKADETLYIRLLENLLSNAVSYRKPEEKERIRVGLFASEEEVTGMVEDNGIGIREEDLPLIWKRFYRADTARTDSGHSGLGLSMVKWIVEIHGGQIHAESREGEGTRFIFTIPIEK